MTGPVARPGRRRAPVRWLAVLGLLVGAVAAWAAGGTGRAAELVATDPAAGARLAAPPAAVWLRFSGPLDPAGSHLTVIGPDGALIAAAEPGVSGDTIRQPVDMTGDGAVAVGYHVRFRDGRELSGWQQFTVGSGGGEPPPGAAQVGRGGGGHAHGGMGVLGALVAAAMLAGSAAVLAVMVRRRRPG